MSIQSGFLPVGKSHGKGWSTPLSALSTVKKKRSGEHVINAACTIQQPLLQRMMTHGRTVPIFYYKLISYKLVWPYLPQPLR